MMDALTTRPTRQSQVLKGHQANNVQVLEEVSYTIYRYQKKFSGNTQVQVTVNVSLTFSLIHSLFPSGMKQQKSKEYKNKPDLKKCRKPYTNWECDNESTHKAKQA